MCKFRLLCSDRLDSCLEMLAVCITLPSLPITKGITIIVIFESVTPFCRGWAACTYQVHQAVIGHLCFWDHKQLSDRSMIKWYCDFKNASRLWYWILWSSDMTASEVCLVYTRHWCTLRPSKEKKMFHIPSHSCFEDSSIFFLFCKLLFVTYI